ncbi:hypothetical protein CI15_06365 [Paraburkholderia monticola]|uniref:Serine/threonine protein kinase n=1 Tax=Paraburkholderia monticola TaxID=1399968 RepID=A0A149PXU9_9BURK|nr:hypothetical protein [Paraburkholderia monticola]KXU89807.1 hypothetical protein CI15_06365 [Paraburkholderia monticola]
MTYPTLEQYQEVLQHPNTAFLDAELARGSVATTGLGMPLAMCGGFALTYTVTTGGRKLAVRCFHKESRELQQRYDAVSRTLRGLSSPYFVAFDFLQAGVKVNGAGYPIVKMDWAQGTTLGEFVEKYYQDGPRLSKLIESLRKLAQYLEGQGIAHGDIQPGNVMVSADGATVQLIDYDGMFVPSLAHMKSAELGHRNFQHPGRSEKHFDARLDRFSFISMDLALRALRASPGLWNTTQSEPESFVFRANDFVAPLSSPTFAALSRIGDCSKDVASFAAVCNADILSTPTLVDFVAGRNIPAAPRYVAPAAGVQLSRTAYLAQHPVLDASQYGVVFKHIGQMVELVGKVVGVAQGKSRRGGRPYVFVNFGDWKGTCVKLAIWSDVLEKMTNAPNSGWVGRWLSIKGLVDPPYSSRKHGYTHLSITVSSASLVHQISEEEARYRLAPAYRVPNVTVTRNGDNESLLASMGRKAAAPAATRPIPPGTIGPQSANQQLLAQLQSRASSSAVGATAKPPPGSSRATSAAAARFPSGGASSSSAPKATRASSPTSTNASTGKNPRKGVPGWVYVVGFIVLWLLVKALARR